MAFSFSRLGDALGRANRALLVGVALLAAVQPDARAERIKDLATIQGVRANQLIGYGLVVGLDGTGDMTTQTPFTVQSISSMLNQMGVTLPSGVNPQLKNVAAVMVTTMLPAFAKPGQPVDVTVSSMGNAKSLRGGTLLLTPLKGADGQVYAIAQGNLVIAGAGASAAGSKAQVNQLNAGRIPNGATVERAVASPFGAGDIVTLELQTGDFGTARRMARAIDARFGEGTANAVDARMVQVRAPEQTNARVGFMAELEAIELEAAQAPAKVIINARTGSIVMNRAVTLEPCAVAHGSLSVSISSETTVSQPNALSGGQTTTTQKADVQIKQEGGAMVAMDAGAKLADVVKALNALGANPQDLLAILQAMKASGALRAELEVI
jgi:flagellar P-ring protein precursor FlgI